MRSRLRRPVRLSGERARHAVRHDCSSAEKQKSPPALLVVVRGERLERQFEPLATGLEAKVLVSLIYDTLDVAQAASCAPSSSPIRGLLPRLRNEYLASSEMARPEATIRPVELAAQLWGSTEGFARSAGARKIRQVARQLFPDEARGKGAA